MPYIHNVSNSRVISDTNLSFLASYVFIWGAKWYFSRILIICCWFFFSLPQVQLISTGSSAFFFFAQFFLGEGGVLWDVFSLVSCNVASRCASFFLVTLVSVLAIVTRVKIAWTASIFRLLIKQWLSKKRKLPKRLFVKLQLKTKKQAKITDFFQRP